MPADRLHPHVVTKELSPNASNREAPVSLIVLHSTEGQNAPHSKSDIDAVLSWFGQRSSEVSAHVVVDSDGNSGRCVPDAAKAWACMSFNSASLNIEQVGFAAQTSWAPAELRETARWIAQWSHEHGIPIRRGRTIGSTVVRSGVTTHKKLGAAGGGHVDPGPGYPLKSVLKMAREIKKARYG